jgi:hypothetical protein
MTPIFILIIAIVLPDGEIKVNHTLVPSCPTQEEIVKVLKPMKENGEIIGWGGNCSPLTPKREASYE